VDEPHVVALTENFICTGKRESSKSDCEYIGQPQTYVDSKHTREQEDGFPYDLTGAAEYNLNTLTSDSWLEESPISDDFYYRMRDRSYKSHKAKSKDHVWFSFRLTTMTSWSINKACVVNQTEFTANVYIQSSELGRGAEHSSVMTKCPDHPNVQRLKPKITSIGDPVAYVMAEFELPVQYCILPVQAVKEAVSAVQSWVRLPQWCNVCTLQGLFVVKPGQGLQQHDLERIWVDTSAPACGKDNPYGWGEDGADFDAEMDAFCQAILPDEKLPSLKSSSKNTQKVAKKTVKAPVKGPVKPHVEAPVKDTGAASSVWSWGDKVSLGGAFNASKEAPSAWWGQGVAGFNTVGNAAHRVEDSESYTTLYSMLAEVWFNLMRSYFPWVSRFGVLGTLGFACSFLVTKFGIEELGTEVWPAWLVAVATGYNVFASAVLMVPCMMISLFYNCIKFFYTLASDIVDNIYLCYRKYGKKYLVKMGLCRAGLDDDYVVFILEKSVFQHLFDVLYDTPRGPGPFYLLPLNSLLWFLFFPGPFLPPFIWFGTSYMLWHMLPHSKWSWRATLCILTSLVFLMLSWEDMDWKFSALFAVILSYTLQAPTGAWLLASTFYWCDIEFYPLSVISWCAVRLTLLCENPRKLLYSFIPWAEPSWIHKRLQSIEEGLQGLGHTVVRVAVYELHWDPRKWKPKSWVYLPCIALAVVVTFSGLAPYNEIGSCFFAALLSRERPNIHI
jgi:hypothetical protein